MLEKYRQILSDQGELYLRVKVRPRSPRSEVKAIMSDETVKIDVAAAPENGRANGELLGFLAREFGVGLEAVKILSGAGDRLKLIKITQSL